MCSQIIMKCFARCVSSACIFPWPPLTPVLAAQRAYSPAPTSSLPPALEISLRSPIIPSHASLHTCHLPASQTVFSRAKNRSRSLSHAPDQNRVRRRRFGVIPSTQTTVDEGSCDGNYARVRQDSRFALLSCPNSYLDCAATPS